MAIDFSNADNIIFLIIVVVLFAIVVFICALIISKILKAVRAIFKKIFPEKQKKIKAGSSASPRRILGENFVNVSVAGNEKKKEEKKNVIEIRNEKDKSDIEKGLAALKSSSGNGEEKETLESRMPDRNEDESDEQDKPIIIPVPRRSSVSVASSGSPMSQTKNAESQNKIIIASSNGSVKNNAISEEKHTGTSGGTVFGEKASPAPSLNILTDNLSSSLAEKISGQKEVATKAAADTTIFNGRDSLTMREATFDITKKAPKVVGGSTFSLKERQEIAKKISNFQKFGNMLQKSERNKIYKTLAKEKYSAKTPDQKIKIDKQVKFLNKAIGK